MKHNQPFNDLPLLPPQADLETPEILKKAIAANRELAELKGAVHSLPNQSILINGIVLQEARLSSEIENIVTTNDELYRADADKNSANSSPQAKEVLRYREALWLGFKKIKNRPLSTNLFVEIVKVIKDLDLDIRKTPGTKIGNSRGEVIYTPPEGESIIREKLANLENFIHAEDGIDPLIKMAIMHYQFEAIHPFIDGNGRTGRILNILYLVEKGLLDEPVLFLSQHILKTRKDYYAGLKNVTEKQDWTIWVTYMLDAIRTTAADTLHKVDRINGAMAATMEHTKNKALSVYSKDLVEIIFQHPYCKTSFLEEAGLAKRQTAATYLKKLEDINVLRSVKIGRERYYINDMLCNILKD